jgi:cyclohexyl-isocyanide hydratase
MRQPTSTCCSSPVVTAASMPCATPRSSITSRIAVLAHDFVTSVCTGSLILGAAGLLAGYKATSYWACRHLVRLFGAQPTDARVVVDRNRITGGGVTAGIDFGLTLLTEILGEDAAKITQLRLEYDPDPPFHSGSPSTAAESTVKVARQRLEPFNQLVEAAAKELTT